MANGQVALAVCFPCACRPFLPMLLGKLSLSIQMSTPLLYLGSIRVASLTVPPGASLLLRTSRLLGTSLLLRTSLLFRRVQLVVSADIRDVLLLTVGTVSLHCPQVAHQRACTCRPRLACSVCTSPDQPFQPYSGKA